MSKKTKPRKLKPIGDGSYAHEHGYEFDILVSWLEDIVRNEQERSGKQYEARTARLESAVDELSQLLEE